MNDSLFKFWRYIQKITLGAIFFLELIFLTIGFDSIIKLIQTNTGNNFWAQFNFTAMFMIVIFLLGTIGSLLSKVILSFFSTIISFIFYNMKPQKNAKNKFLYYLMFSYYKLAYTEIIDGLEHHINHFRLRSLGNSMPEEQIKRIDEYYTNIKSYLLSIKNYKHFFTLVNQGTVTQEQKKLENLEWDCEIICYLFFTVEIIFFIGISINFISLITGIFLITLCPIIFIPEYINCKKQLISYLISISGSIFQFGTPADLEDRESF